MNILPKKRWHVRTKDNIARVRRDEAQAAEEEKEKQRKILKAEQETRTELLRSKINKDSRLPSSKINKESQPSSSTSKHINFFDEEESGTTENKDYVKEKKELQEKYEKSIGYLTYLGQNSNEAQGVKPWYETVNRKAKKDDTERGVKTKNFLDPLKTIKKHVGSDHRKIETRPKSAHKLEVCHRLIRNTLGLKEKGEKRKKCKKHKSKKHRKHSSTESESETEDEKRIRKELLREERLLREQEERQRANELLRKREQGDKKEELPEEFQKYSSQFNPHLARQNYA